MNFTTTYMVENLYVTMIISLERKFILKHLSDAPPRLQRLLLKIQLYDIKDIPGPKSYSGRCTKQSEP